MRYSEDNLLARRRALASIGVVLGTGALATSSSHGNEVRPPLPGKLSFLIACLVSPNEKPNSVMQFRTGPNYDRKAQAVVYLAANQLLREDAEGIRALLAAKEDDRYSFTYLTPNRYSDRSVSGAIGEILFRMVTFGDIVTDFWLIRYNWMGDLRLKEWIAKQDFDSLIKLQRLALEVQINSAESKMYDGKIRWQYSRYAEVMSEKDFLDCRSRLLEQLRTVQKRLQCSDDPIVFPSIDRRDAKFVGGEWEPGELSAEA